MPDTTSTTPSTVYVGGFNPATESQPSPLTQVAAPLNYVSPTQAVMNAAANPVPPATTTISSDILSPTTQTPYTTPSPTPIPSVSSLDTSTVAPLTETPEEEKASSLTSSVEDLNNSMVGKSSYQTAQDTANGVDTLTQQQKDLSTQLTQLKNEASAIPQQLQLDATGRGITTGGLAPISTAALRNNSIQALSVSSMLDATNGLLASAQAKADKAVAAKYDPIQEQINAATANLKLIMSDPQTTLDDKNRAEAQSEALAARQATLDKQKQNATDVLTASISAAKNGADASTLQKMQAAPDGQTALQIATAAGYGSSDVNDLMTKYPDAGIAPGDSVQQAQAKVIASPSYTMAEKSTALDNAYKQAEINKDSKATTDLSTNQQTIITALNNEIASSPAGKSFPQIADLYASVAGIDPTTTDPVKQGQVLLALAQMEVPGSKSVRGVLNAVKPEDMDSGVWTVLNNAQKMIEAKGSLSPDALKSVLDTMGSIYDAQASSYNSARTAAVNGAVARGIPGADQYLTNYAADTGVDEVRAQTAINEYTKNNPTMATKITAAMAIPGMTEADLLQYMKQPTSGFDNYGDLP